MAGALCCSVVCEIGAGCSPLTVPPAGLLLGDSKAVVEGATRHVLLSCEASLELPLVELQLRMGEVQRSCMISVADTLLRLQKRLQCTDGAQGVTAAQILPQAGCALALSTEPSAEQATCNG